MMYIGIETCGLVFPANIDVGLQGLGMEIAKQHVGGSIVANVNIAGCAR